MTSQLLLVGSVPLETAEDVFRVFGAPLGPYLATMPDGEVGDRKWWVQRLSYQVFNGHPHLHAVRRPAPDGDVERLVPRDRTDTWQFVIADGIRDVKFGDPGWRLGFTKDALSSYFVFRTLREKGVLAKHLRFQVSIPLVNSVIGTRTFPRPGDAERVKPGYEAAVAAEVAKIVEKIPHDDLAIQWDASWEITDVYGGIPGQSPDEALARNTPQIARLSRVVPETVALGFHFCFGTFGGWPRLAPPDLGGAVDLANAAVAAAGRRVDWINIPSLDRSDDDFFRPLARLRPHGARVYLGLIHNMARFGARLAAARRHLADFGLSAPCGFGRIPETALPGILQDHLDAVRIAAR
jgi:hypothetical protein